MSLSMKQMIKLPSQGKFYPSTHPFHNKEQVEIRLLNAKDEDLLTTKSLIKSGKLPEILVKEVLIDKSVNVDTLLIGDFQAILIYARIYSLGTDYDALATCEYCQHTDKYVFDISSVPMKICDEDPVVPFTNIMKYTKDGLELEYYLLTVGMLKDIEKDIEAYSKINKNVNNNNFYTLLHTLKSINGSEEKKEVNNFLNNNSIKVLRDFKKHLNEVTPTLEFTSKFYCTDCGNVNEEVKLEFNQNFFWSDSL